MFRRLLIALVGVLTGAAFAAEPAVTPVTKRANVVVIPVHNEIASPVLYILRRGLKEAAAQHADVVVLDLKTPGGALDTTFDIMEALAKFPGKTVAFVNNEAMSAGAFISAMTDEIWFTPDGVIGAAAPVMATGQDVDATMKLKITSYLKARMRSISEGKGYRGQVISAMIDADFELKIGDKVLKEKGELLSLTAAEASKVYGDPPQSLLAAGMAKNVTALLTKKFGVDGYTVRTLEITWSERLAVYLNQIAPILLGLGMLALFIEFKTPGFGVFGITGIVLLGFVFLSSFVAGLSGHEPVLFFGLGLVLLAVEVFFFPGTIVLGLSGLTMIFGSLVWAMADLWPNEPLTVAWSGDAFLQPLVNLGLGLAIAVALAVALLRFLPHGWFWDKMILGAAVAAQAQAAGGVDHAEIVTENIVGRRGVAKTTLRPSGQVEIDGRRYEARVEVGTVESGAAVIVVRRTDFELVVEKGGA
jgi:membrane-bound serine protease (ClpP class)